jgi:hypothetical protein
MRTMLSAGIATENILSLSVSGHKKVVLQLRPNRRTSPHG